MEYYKNLDGLLEVNGFEEGRAGSLKQILKTAYQAKMIQDEELWLTALGNCIEYYSRY